MTTRWAKEDQYLRLIVEGQSCDVNSFKAALEIDIDANILIDCMAISDISKEVLNYLNEFAATHKKKHLSILLAYPNKIGDFDFIERTNTLSEARDIIFMEITERELGFFDEEEM